MDPGMIPWSRIVFYGEYVGLKKDNMKLFLAVIRAMDLEYLEWSDKESKKLVSRPDKTSRPKKEQK